MKDSHVVLIIVALVAVTLIICNHFDNTVKRIQAINQPTPKPITGFGEATA